MKDTASLQERTKALDKVLAILANHDPVSQQRILLAAAVFLGLEKPIEKND